MKEVYKTHALNKFNHLYKHMGEGIQEWIK